MCLSFFTDLPRSTLTVTPDRPIFTGETVNLTCVIESYSEWRKRNGLTNDRRNYWMYEWRYEWYKGTDSVMSQTSERYNVIGDTLSIVKEGQYTCKGNIEGRSVSSHTSSAVSLSVIGELNIIVLI